MATTDIIVQIALLILTLAMFYSINYLSKQTLSKLRTKTRITVQASHHLAQATRLLARAKSTQGKTNSHSISKHALSEAHMAVSIDPRDPHPHILKAKILEFMGLQSSALKSLDLALNLSRVKSLSCNERGELLVKRAELKLCVNRRRRVDSAVEDLKEAVRLSRHTHLGELCNFKATAFSLLSQCYDFMGLKDDAKRKNTLEEG